MIFILLTYAGTATSQTNVSGNQSGTWTLAGSPYIINSSITIPSGQTLIIQPGVAVKLASYTSLFTVNGTLIANGTPTDSIHFYGTKNGTFTHGGQFYFSSGSVNSSIQYADFDSLGYSYNYNGLIYTVTNSFLLSHSSIRNSSTYPFYLTDDAVRPILQDCNFSGSNALSRTLYCSPGTVANMSNITNAILDLNGSLTQNATWKKPGTGTLYKASSVTVNAGKTLTIDPGTRILLPSYTTTFIVNGTLIANGTPTDSIWFYGTKNGTFTHGGQFYFSSGSVNSSIQYADFDSLGYSYNYNGLISTATNSFLLSHSSIRNSSTYPFYLTDDAVRPILQDCNFSGSNALSRTLYCSPGTVANMSSITNAILDLNGSLTQNATWKKPGTGTLYKASSVTVNAGKTLTIDPGNRILLPSYTTTFIVNGTLIANGTPTDSIHFYGTKNNSSYTHGGTISLEAGSSGSSFKYTSLDSLGYPYNYDAAIRTAGGLLISNSTIKNTYQYGIKIERSNVVVSNNNFSGANNNGWSAYLVSDTISPTIQGCLFSGNVNARTINGRFNSFTNLQNNTNAILLFTNSSITSNTTLGFPGSNSYYQFQSNLSIPANMVLTVEPGVLLDFNTTSAGISVTGGLRTLGSESSPVQFTRVNSSGSASSNFGGTISFNANSNAVLNNTNISRLGSGISALTFGTNVTTQINNINVSGNFNRGITISGSSPTINNSIISGNQTGILVTLGKPVFSNCNILSNTSFGISNTSGVVADTVDARTCWWGDITGPRQTTTNPGGLGNQVSLKVKYNPWLNQPTGNLITDIGITLIDSPKSDCNLLSNEQVKVKISNFGNIPKTGFNVGYTINNANPVTENVGSLNVPAGGTVDYSFATRANLSQQGSVYTFRAYTMLSGDTIKLNDTTTKIIEHHSQLTAPNNLLPVNNSIDINKPVSFSWSSVSGAVSYDLFVWADGASVPTTPTVSGITQINYNYDNVSLLYGSVYKWKVRAIRNTCSIESVIQTFTIRNLPDLVVEEITVPPTAFSETDISFSWKIKNQGLGNTGSAQWIERVYLSEATQLNVATDYFISSFPNFSALNAGQIYQAPNRTFRIPPGLQGNYYIIVTVDSFLLNWSQFPNNVLETFEHNNSSFSSAIAITLSPPPDLQVPNLIVSPSTVFSEDSLTVKWNVQNNGTGPTMVTQWNDAVYLSTSATFNQAGSTLLINRTHNGALAVNGTYNDSVKVKLPVNIQGTYYVHVLIDRYNAVFENTNEYNNTATSQALNIILRPAPNLVVTNITVPPDTLSIGQQLNLQWTIKNEGAAATISSFRDDIYISTNNIFNAGQDILIGSLTHGNNLASLGTITGQVPVQIPSIFAQGNYYFFIKTDAADNINEFPNENDNISTAAGPIFVALPDLVTGNLQSPATALSEQIISVGYACTNTGLGNLITGSWTDKVYLSTDNVFNSGDILLGSVTNNNILLRNTSYSRQVSVSIPQAIAGNYFILVISNAGGSINESNNNNNLVYAPISISLASWPDLIVTAVPPTTNNTAGLPVTVNYTGKNNGTGSILNKQWSDHVLLSPTNTLSDPNNRLLGSVAQNRSLNPAETYSAVATFTIPANTIPGMYYIVVATDAANTIFENTSENNNRTISTAIAVAALPNVDLAVISGSLNTNTVMAGQPVQANYTVQNAGTTNTLPGGWTDAIYLSNNTVIDANDRLLGSWQVNMPLTPSATISHNRTVTIPTDASGTLYLLVLTDVNNAQNDINRGNNFLTLNTGSGGGGIVIVQPTPVDLQPVSLTAPVEVLAGQPLSVNFTVRNNGPGTTFANNWMDNVYMATSANATSGSPSSSIQFTGSLAANATYSNTTQFFVPNNFSGNYVVLLRTNANNTQNELNGGNNNIISSPIIVTPQQPCDLVISSVTTPAGTQIAGQPVTLQWQVKNQGQNAANGYFRDAVYLSLDTLFDAATDILMGTVDGTSNIIPGQTINRQLTAVLNNVVTGNYYVIVRADILNNLTEINENNNTGISTSPIVIDVKQLLMGVPANDTLFNGRALYYRISITAAQANETMSLKLFGDTVRNAVNRLYLKYGQVPTGNSYDFVAEIPFKANQQIIVPALQAGTYYIMAVGNDTSALHRQLVQLVANIIPFSVTTVNADKGGNTGNVTVKITGAKFTAATQFILQKSGTGAILPLIKYYVDASTVFVTYNLLSKATGFYNVVAINQNNDSAKLLNAFEIVTGPGGSGSGGGSGPGGGPGFICQVVNIGFENLIQTDLLYPEFIRLGRVESIIIHYENTGTIDIPMPIRFIISLTGVPVGFTIAELDSGKTSLALPFAEPGGPSGILRAGASGFIKVFTKATLRIPEIQFVITE